MILSMALTTKERDMEYSIRFTNITTDAYNFLVENDCEFVQNGKLVRIPLPWGWKYVVLPEYIEDHSKASNRQCFLFRNQHIEVTLSLSQGQVKICVPTSCRSKTSDVDWIWRW